MKQCNYFYVYQNKTYDEERAGGFLWSPKYARGWHQNAGYETMKQVAPGDVIFHSYRGEIVAISRAKTSCYTYPRPNAAFSEWANDGWRIDVSYHVLNNSFKVAPYIQDLYRIQPINGPYTSAFRGKQQYLCNANKALFDYLLDRILKIQNPTACRSLQGFLRGEVEIAVKQHDQDRSSVDVSSQGPSDQLLDQVVDHCKVDAIIEGQNKKTTFTIDVDRYQKQKVILGKTVGDVFNLAQIPLTYRIEKIYR